MYQAVSKFFFALIPALALGSAVAEAQDLNEAFNLSNLTVQGTARSMGFGGALGSVGGDFSAISVNPGGLGIYRSSELSFSPAFKVNAASSTYQGNNDNAANVRLGISNFGVVFTDAPKGKRYERRDWKAVSFAMGMNRVADFNHDYTYNGNNKTGSASLAFESSANQDSNNVNDPSTLAYMGYYSGLLNGYLPGSYTTRVPLAGGINQLNSVKERGSINEYVFSLGGNYKEKLMLGATLGIPSIKYSRVSDYTESLLPGNTNNPYHFQSLTYNNNLTITGTGVNLKVGAIYKVADYFRVGLAIHSPTIYNLHDVTDYGLSTAVEGALHNVSTGNDLSQIVFDYQFVTPIRSVASATFILKKFGFITADYEYVSYSTMRFIYPDGMDGMYSYAYEAKQINNAIKDMYHGASNLRIGAEAKITRYFMLRGGFGYYGNPYKTPYVPSERIDISGGVGYRKADFFADFAFVNSHYQFAEQPYNNIDYTYVTSAKATAVPVATIKQMVNNVAFTVGVKF